VTIYTKTARNYHRNGFQLLKETHLGIRALCGSYMLRFTAWCIKKDHGWTVIAKIKNGCSFFLLHSVLSFNSRWKTLPRCALLSVIVDAEISPKNFRRYTGSDRTTDKNRVVSAAARLNI